VGKVSVIESADSGTAKTIDLTYYNPYTYQPETKSITLNDNASAADKVTIRLTDPKDMFSQRKGCR